MPHGAARDPREGTHNQKDDSQPCCEVIHGARLAEERLDSDRGARSVTPSSLTTSDASAYADAAPPRLHGTCVFTCRRGWCMPLRSLISRFSGGRSPRVRLAQVAVLLISLIAAASVTTEPHRTGASGAGTWTLTTAMAQGRSEHTATLLDDGRTLIAGGQTGGPVCVTELGTSELFDTVAGQWSTGGAMNVRRFGHTATRLQDGTVLVAGSGTASRV